MRNNADKTRAPGDVFARGFLYDLSAMEKWLTDHPSMSNRFCILFGAFPGQV
jgi:hypothetical protein